MNPAPEISVVVPVYNEEENVATLRANVALLESNARVAAEIAIALEEK